MLLSVWRTQERELRLSFPFSSSDPKGIRLNAYLDSIGTAGVVSIKPSTPGSLPAPERVRQNVMFPPGP
jgi:hypothetical protein